MSGNYTFSEAPQNILKHIGFLHTQGRCSSPITVVGLQWIHASLSTSLLHSRGQNQLQYPGVIQWQLRQKTVSFHLQALLCLTEPRLLLPLCCWGLLLAHILLCCVSRSFQHSCSPARQSPACNAARNLSSHMQDFVFVPTEFLKVITNTCLQPVEAPLNGRALCFTYWLVLPVPCHL